MTFYEVKKKEHPSRNKMGKSRRSTRRGRKGSRKHGGRRGGKSMGLLSRVYSPVNHLFQAAENSVNSLARGTGSIVRTGLNSVNKVGKSIANHGDRAASNILSRRRKSRKNRR